MIWKATVKKSSTEVRRKFINMFIHRRNKVEDIRSSNLDWCEGTTPGIITNKEWVEETDKKFQAWPRTAGPPVVMTPISRQNFIVKGSSEE
ncbi:hypothetical protein AgCh_030248 [Apium graveolens]